MPTSPQRERRDGTEVEFRARSQAVGRAEPEPEYGDGPQGEDALFASVVGSTAHREKNEDAVFRLVNQVRAKAGLGRVRTDERLRKAALAHSKDMARRDFCAHENPDGVTPAERMMAAGYPAPGAENVARGQASPRSVMLAWMNSPGHRANLLDPRVTAIGIGVAFVAGNGPYWTQNFGY